MSEQTFSFEVAMTCEGCANAVRKVLGKQGDKVTVLDVNVDTKTVQVKSILSEAELIEILKKTGKAVTVKA